LEFEVIQAEKLGVEIRKKNKSTGKKLNYLESNNRFFPGTQISSVSIPIINL